MMNFEKFTEWVAEDLQRLLGEEYRIDSTLVTKNNGVKLRAITIEHTQYRTTPVIYMEPLYQSYKKGTSIERLTGIILNKMKNEQTLALTFAEEVKSLESVRDHIAYRLVSREMNEELLKDIPWTKWNDLAIIYYIHLETSGDKQISTLIHNCQMEKWNLSLDELHELAKENTPKLCPSVSGRLDHWVIGWDDDNETVSRDSGIPSIYILSNQAGINGAICMLYEDVMKGYSDMLESDLIILPSSIHEILFLSYKEGVNLEAYKTMVSSVNAESVPAEEVLSDNVYLYSREDNSIRVVE